MCSAQIPSVTPPPLRSEQSEPLDLRVLHPHDPSFICSPFKKQKYLFYQSEPMDLSVRQHSNENSFSSLGSENYISSDVTETDCNHPNTPTVFQTNTVFLNCYRNENTAEDIVNKTIPRVSRQSPLDLSKEKINKTNCLDDNNYMFSNLDSSCLKNIKSSYLTSVDYSAEGFKNRSLITESNALSKSTVNDIQSPCNESRRDGSQYMQIKNENLKNRSSKNNSEGKVKIKSPGSSCNINPDIAVNEFESDKIQNENLKSFVKNRNVECNIEQDEGLDTRKLKLDCSVSSSPNGFTKPSVKQLKKTGESFIQDGKCFEVAPKLPRCRECSLALQETLGKTQLGSGNVLCRFFAFRKLRYSPKGFLATAGFLDPHCDPTEEDMRLWQPLPDAPLPDLDVQMAKYLLTHVGDQFCDLCKQEEEAVSIHMSEDKTPAWKRPVPGCREMCDVCNTTLFNFHWTCKTCGFAVCIDCYKARRGCVPGGLSVEKPWMICVSKRAHDQEKMMLTQIIAADSLKYLKQKAHEVRLSLGLPLSCCFPSPPQIKATTCQADHSPTQFNAKRIVIKGEEKKETILMEEHFGDKLSLPSTSGDKTDCGVSSSKDEIVSFQDYSSDKETYLSRFYSSLRKQLLKPDLENPTLHLVSTTERSIESNVSCEDALEQVVLSVFNEVAVGSGDSPYGSHLAHCYNSTPPPGRGTIPARVMTLTESRLLYPDCPHSWLCEGRLLKLSEPTHPGNYQVFQDQWKRGQPVLVSGVLKFLDKSLWQPDSFIRDFGDTKNDLVNCMTGRVIPGQYMRMFWEGFQEMTKMLKDEKGKPMLLKLKDWPPGEDFAEMLPARFENLMQALPMGEYTKRTGQLNLPSRLPSIFARPDLGPKMYIAYGSAIHPTKGTTNLHLDISDAVNVMVYVGIPKDIDHDEFISEAYNAVDEACFEVLMRRRVRSPSEVPGALWHIYSAWDADKIRHLLTRAARERKMKLGPHQDPIHDQNWYLDAALRERLYREYGVRGYAIVQCLGDAVFIPAGAPHQVRNLLNCIKVAEDFVSPENVSHCLHLTQEFRKLSDFHSNHEDKLQIKNIIYHAVKESLAVLSPLSDKETL